MSKILVSGLLNIESNISVKSFPINYAPIDYKFFGVSTDVSGVGYNVSLALATLGNNVTSVSYLANDTNGKTILNLLKDKNINTNFLKFELKQTPTSAVLFDDNGKRMVYCDLKDIQEKIYPLSEMSLAINNCDALVLCNINFNDEIINNAKSFNKTIFSDVHIVNDVNDEYNKRFMKNSDVLFMSDEAVFNNRENFIYRVYDTYKNKVIVMGCGSDGALLFDGKEKAMYKINSVSTRTVVNTCGAGDSLFSAFVHEYLISNNPIDSIKKAVAFASYKIGESGGAKGFLNNEQLNNLCSNIEFKIIKL